MSTLYRAGDVIQPSSAHDSVLSGIVADVIAAETQPCRDERAREMVTVRMRGTGFIAYLDADDRHDRRRGTRRAGEVSAATPVPAASRGRPLRVPRRTPTAPARRGPSARP